MSKAQLTSLSLCHSRAALSDATNRDSALLWRSARRFLFFSLILAAVDFVYQFLFQSESFPNYLVWYAAIVAMCGLWGPAIARQEASRIVAWSTTLFSIFGLCASFATRGATDRVDLSGIRKFVTAEACSTAAVFVAFLALYAVTGGLFVSPYNAHVAQAYAFLHGHTYIDPAPEFIEHVDFRGHSYQLHPPLPAILLMPFVAIWGMDTNQSLYCLIGGAVDVALAWRLLGRMGLSTRSRCWLTIFLGAGTTMWFEAINGGSWDLTMVVAVGFTIAALSEIYGQARPGVIGMLAGLSTLARYDLALDFPIFVALIYLRRRNLRELVWIMPGYLLAAVVYVAFNEARYSTIFDVGLFLWIGARTQLFSLRFFVQDFYTLFIMNPIYDDNFPYLHPTGRGLALTFTAPAFVLALRPSIKERMTQLMMAGALLAMLPSLFYFSNGEAQFGARHYVHAYPFLFVLLAMGVPRTGVDQLTKALIITSVVSISFWIWHVRVWGL